MVSTLRRRIINGLRSLLMSHGPKRDHAAFFPRHMVLYRHENFIIRSRCWCGFSLVCAASRLSATNINILVRKLPLWWFLLIILFEEWIIIIFVHSLCRGYLEHCENLVFPTSFYPTFYILSVLLLCVAADQRKPSRSAFHSRLRPEQLFSCTLYNSVSLKGPIRFVSCTQ